MLFLATSALALSAAKPFPDSIVTDRAAIKNMPVRISLQLILVS
jgi:hypothetical protein